MSEQAVETPSWRSKDLALVSFLSLQGFRFQHMEVVTDQGVRHGRSVYWWFDDSEELQESISTFIQGDAAVEPSAYSEKFAMIKMAMNRFLRSH